MFVFSAKSQTTSEARIVVESVSDLHGKAVEILINRAEEKDILKAWKSVLKDYEGEVKVKGNSAEALEVLIPLISKNPLKVVAEVKSGPENQKVFVAIFMEGDINHSETATAKRLVEDMAKELSKEATEEYQNSQEKALKSLQAELKDLIRDKEKAEKNIEDCKESIKEAEYDLKQNEKDRTKLQEKIKEQEKKLKEANEEVKSLD